MKSIALVMLTLIIAVDGFAQESGPTTSLRRFSKDAQTYVITRDGKQELTWSPKPILHWDNPARNGEDGAFYVWTLDGRPEVVGSVFTYRRASTGRIVLKHTLHSVSEKPLSAEYEGAVVWAPKTPGVKFAPIPDADPPAETSRLRLIQARAFARDFSANFTDLKKQTTELRLLPQPLIRYEPKNSSVMDGALFAFAEGTDPQVMLLVETRGGADQRRWEYAFVRSHFVELRGFHRGQEVWHLEADPSMTKASFGFSEHSAKTYWSVAKDEWDASIQP
jgi:hypothetical protein